ncbi:MAG TPA: hypothetical protein VL201_04005 [Patescibacteria group bacterium]|jgi:hypothetical protein|nr:hypothetical protein [Patescibacteria group bacterium]
MLIFCLLFGFFYNTLFSAGFTANTLVFTQEGRIAVQHLQYTHAIIGQNNVLQKVIKLQTYIATQAICIQIVDDFIVCHKDQLFWCANKNRWQKTSFLRKNDTVLTFDGNILPIANVTTVQKERFFIPFL